MAYIIGSILIVIALIITGLILRKRVYDVVDRYEAWKMDIMDRNINAELSRIKILNLSGETQDKFEAWKERWEHIVTKELTDIEELLFDAEAAADRYRFSRAKKTLAEVEKILQTVEVEIEQIIKEVDELLHSEEESRKEIEHVEPTLKDLRKKLSQNRYQYGKAESYFEARLDELFNELASYYQLVEGGNYLEAKELVDKLKLSLDNLEKQFDEFPQLYRMCKQELPSQLDDLLSGIKEMKSEGYRVEHLAFEKEIRNYQQKLLHMVDKLDNGDMANAEILIEEIEVRSKEMYQLLEKEAIAKNYVETKMPTYQHVMEEVTATFHHTKQEVDQLQKAYYFEDSDMEKYLSLEKSIAKLNSQMEAVVSEMEEEKSPHTKLRNEIEAALKEIETLKESHEAFKKRIQNLRKDELEAKEKLTEMRNQLYSIQRKLKKSNVPGVPTFIWNLIETANDKNARVVKALENQPLEMAEVQQALNDAKNAVSHCMEQTNLMLEQAYLTEQVIQYANRYRSQYPLLAEKLSESERLFRKYEYELALENAAKAVEEVEPGALKRIEVHQSEVEE
ncbi:septation ring formation regulator EzrA [Virgibacillus pantothenticus]|uniref:Septation ring formation regulator EzrA n=1 Tax=Virgibacillus pantothenticus TaxID=1473 RepID=A0A0L0QQA5_VIRPA|nr:MULTISPECIES: septation ring formation regulator EzrA [Virgibacillus]API90853.1 selenide, water dikinase [Virgibacillus sp. 6R]KNE20800.1 selenide, water dikinase [Virgibacillus pantothenticus]MBS7426711.1 septation ring formation regulator EzrA [Virgibacillus sp. 19R1-5]MBU8566039.1 septation ring formation regulator EzrA [Virgibacillus pantothenticus]MBU8602788.1 septation ring formation regulator EzrA [Virgibacillus pantothenticus]